MSALDALESAVGRRREADRDEDELATQKALGADRSRLADELDTSLVKSRKLERTMREDRRAARIRRSAPSVRCSALPRAANGHAEEDDHPKAGGADGSADGDEEEDDEE